MSHSERKRQPDYAAHPVEGQQTILDVFPGMRATTDADGHRTIKIPNTREMAKNKENEQPARNVKGPYFDPKQDRKQDKNEIQNPVPSVPVKESLPQNNNQGKDEDVSVSAGAEQPRQADNEPEDTAADKVLDGLQKEDLSDAAAKDDILSSMSPDEVKKSFSDWLRTQKEQADTKEQETPAAPLAQPEGISSENIPVKETSEEEMPRDAAPSADYVKENESAPIKSDIIPLNPIGNNIYSPTVAAFKAAVAAYNNDPIPEPDVSVVSEPVHNEGHTTIIQNVESEAKKITQSVENISGASALQAETAGSEQSGVEFTDSEQSHIETETPVSSGTEKALSLPKTDMPPAELDEDAYLTPGDSSEQYAASKLFSKGIRRFSEEDTVKRIKGCSIEDLRDVTDDINEYLTVRLNNGRYFYSFFDIERLRKVFTYISNQPGGYDATNLLIYCEEHFTKPYDNARSDMAALPAQINDELKNIRGTVSLEMRNILMPVFSNFTQELQNTNSTLATAYDVIRQQSNLIEGQQKQLITLAGGMNELSDQLSALSKAAPGAEIGRQMDSVKNDITSLIKSNAAEERKNNEARQKAFEEQKKALEDLAGQAKDEETKKKLHDIEELLKSGNLSVKMPEINIPEPKDDSESLHALEQQIRSSQGSTSRTLDKIAEISEKIDMLADMGPTAENADSTEILSSLKNILSMQETTEKGVSELFNKFDELQMPTNSNNESDEALQDALSEVDDLKKQISELQNSLTQKTAQVDELSSQNGKLDLLVQKMLEHGTPVVAPAQTSSYEDRSQYDSDEQAAGGETSGDYSGYIETEQEDISSSSEDEFAAASDETNEEYSEPDSDDVRYQDSDYENSDSYSEDYNDAADDTAEYDDAGTDYESAGSVVNEYAEDGYQNADTDPYNGSDISQDSHEDSQTAQYDTDTYNDGYSDGYQDDYAADSQGNDGYDESQYSDDSYNEPSNDGYYDEYSEEQYQDDAQYEDGQSYDDSAYNDSYNENEPVDGEEYATDEIRLEIPSQNITGHYRPLPPNEESISEEPITSFHSRPNIVVDDVEEKSKKKQKNSRRHLDEEDDDDDDNQEAKKPKKKKGFFFHR